MTVVLFVISLAALERSPGPRSILLSLALGLFSLKNLTLTYLYLVDDLPDIHPLMFVDAVVTGFILLRLLVSGKMGSGTNSNEEVAQQSTPRDPSPPPTTSLSTKSSLTSSSSPTSISLPPSTSSDSTSSTTSFSPPPEKEIEGD